MGTERHGWRRVEAFALSMGRDAGLLAKVMPGSQVVERDWGRWASVRRRTSRSTGAAGDASWESEVSGRRPVTLVVRRPGDRS